MPSTMKENLCAICCEENKPDLISLDQCSHTSCQGCLAQWIEKVESTGQTDLPGCPFCRVPLTLEETNEILGRPFQRASAMGAALGGADEEMDDLTRQWLNEQTKPCPRCGAWIEKIEGGCDMMECLCGYRWCYGCGAPGARCGCTPETHSFWDNVLDRNAGSSPQREAPLREGFVDLMAHIEKRKKQDQDEKLRKKRAVRRNEKARECQYLDEVTSSAKWLFLPTQKATYRVLDQVMLQRKVQRERQRRKYDILEQQAFPQIEASARWLFLPVMAAYRVLEQQKRSSVYHQRQRKRAMRAQEEASLTPLEYSARWLFCNRRTGFRMLSQQKRMDRDHHKRTWNAKLFEEDEAEPDIHITSGQWLFRKKSPVATSHQVKRLFKHQSRAKNARTRRRFEVQFASLGSAYPFGGKRSDGPEEELENALNIRCLFVTDEEKAIERKEVAKYGLS